MGVKRNLGPSTQYANEATDYGTPESPRPTIGLCKQSPPRVASGIWPRLWLFRAFVRNADSLAVPSDRALSIGGAFLESRWWILRARLVVQTDADNRRVLHEFRQPALVYVTHQPEGVVRKGAWIHDTLIITPRAVNGIRAESADTRQRRIPLRFGHQREHVHACAMRIVRFIDDAGHVHHGTPVNSSSARPLLSATGATPVFSQGTIRIAAFLPPVEPPNIFAIGRNYRAHVVETGARLPETPLIFEKPTTALTGHDTEIVLPEAAPHEVDFEAELAIVIGRPARRVPPKAALNCVLGYTCANDVSARDCQRLDKQWTRAKGFDTFCPLGPWLVTADELHPDRLGIRSRLNGRLMQDSNTSHMIFACAELISYLSHQFTLLPNTVILTGTPEGVGFARRPPVFLQAGDRIEVEIEGIGTLCNVVRGPGAATA